MVIWLTSKQRFFLKLRQTSHIVDDLIFFNNKQQSVAELLSHIKEEAQVWLLAGFKQIGPFPCFFWSSFRSPAVVM